NQRVAKPAYENPALIGKQADKVLNKMRWACKPQTEGREKLAVVLGHCCEDPHGGQQAIEQERRENDIAQRARDGGSAGILLKGRRRWRNDISWGSSGHTRAARVGLGGRLL